MRKKYRNTIELPSWIETVRHLFKEPHGQTWMRLTHHSDTNTCPRKKTKTFFRWLGLVFPLSEGNLEVKLPTYGQVQQQW